jgi:homocysteine S-methyltransferase
VHLDYFRAGARVATTASYQASFPGFMSKGLTREQAAELMRLSVRLAQEARAQFLAEDPLAAGAPHPLVAASIGCYGAFLHDGSEYRGDYGLTLRQLIDWHRPRLETLLEAGPDLLACETIPCLLEGEALARLLEDYPQTPAWLSFSCRDETHLCHGEKFSAAVQVANDVRNVVAAGVNCTPPHLIEGLLMDGASVAQKTLLTYPNSGEGWDARGQSWTGGAQPFSWQEGARRWLDAGARWIGGCCRTTPETIRLLGESLGA